MGHQVRFYIFIILLVAFASYLAWYYLIGEPTKRKKKADAIFQEYQDAINAGDRASALRIGRLYYQALRPDGRLTIYDEQAITNDLATIKN